jgi:hypothetical protein
VSEVDEGKPDPRLEKLVADLSAPLFIYRMGRGLSHPSNDSRSEANRRGAIRRMRQAEATIGKIMREYIEEVNNGTDGS